MQWFYTSGGLQFGPIEESVLFQMARDGQLKPTDLVWNSSMGSQWIEASSIPGLFPAGPMLVSERREPGTGGKTPNRDLMRQARESLTGYWGIALGAMIVYQLILGAVQGAQLVLGGPMMLGLSILFLSISRRTGSTFSQLFDGFSNFATALCAYLLTLIFIILWTLLLIVPGIIATLSYAMTFYIIADDPSVGALEAIQRSKEMMQGHKWKLFYLHWRFFWRALLCLLTCGIGFFWLGPYMQASTAKFYDDIAW